MKRSVLDASAVIAFLEDRPGAEEVEKLLTEGVTGQAELFMSVVNWGEVYYSIWRSHGREAARKAAAEMAQLPVEVANADIDLTKVAAQFRVLYKLPYADCFAAALAKGRRARVVTTDQDFAVVKSEIEIRFL
jgi:predicted nucleic acid-binding protein